ncbi:unnamed protein product [Diabrotica balteata]|uniref:MADF domain-containing protein n=1 Tax=Diabrotica balteata TaxID=107213 RepID=A0A9N9T850_DIABA|nr:unnamed protein product [Diabrotica balteata]
MNDQISEAGLNKKRKHKEKKKNVIKIKKAKGIEHINHKKDIQKKWNGIRNTYSAERRKILDSQKSGAGVSEIYVPKLWYHHKLQFLNEYLTTRKPVSSFEINEGASTSSQDVGTSSQDVEYELGDDDMLSPLPNTLTDWKSKRKAKAASLRKAQQKTGAGSPQQPLLSTLENRLLSIMGVTAVIGNESVFELGFGENQVDETPTNQPSTSRTNSEKDGGGNKSVKRKLDYQNNTGTNKKTFRRRPMTVPLSNELLDLNR